MPDISPFVRKPLALSVFLLLAGGIVWSQTDSDATDPAPPAKDPTVALTIDFGDGFEKRYTAIPFVESMTVLSALEAAKSHPHATSFSFRGQGATAFLTDIDGVRNEGASGRNWIFYINEALGKKSFGQQELLAGDAVTWKLESR